MVRKVCIDSDAFIEIINNSDKGKRIVSKIENCKVFITSINAFELMSREKYADKMQKYLSRFDTLDFTEEDAMEAAKIRVDLKERGKMVDYGDLFIASIVKNSDAELLTLNTKHFENIPGLKLVKA